MFPLNPRRFARRTQLAFLFMLVAVFWLLSGPQPASAVPANDNFANATVIASVPYTITQQNGGATTEPGEPLPCGNKGATSWWRFTPTVDMQVTADTVGSAYDTVLAVYTGSAVNALTNLACNDDFSGTQSQVSFLGRAGVTYQIQAGGKFQAAGQLTLNVNGVASTGVPSLINFQGRLTNPANGNPIADGTYAVAFRIFDVSSGGTALWTETQQVAVSSGLFHVLLGANTPLTAGIFNGTTRFLEVQAGADPPMTPRQRLAAVPYAMQAEVLRGPTGKTLSWNDALDRFDLSDELNVAGHGTFGGSLAQYGSDFFLNQDGPDGYSHLYYFEDGSNIGEELGWNNDFDHFHLTDDLLVTGDLNVTGVKNAAVETSQGSRLTAAIESPGVWFEDFGNARLEDGRAVVSLDSLFGETVNTEVDYHVFLTPLGESAGLYVADKTPASFEVRAADGGGDVAFDYRIVAKRRGYEDDRLEPFAMNDQPDTGAAAAAPNAAAVGAGPAGEAATAGDGPTVAGVGQAAGTDSSGSGALYGLLIGLPLVVVPVAMITSLLRKKALAGRRS